MVPFTIDGDPQNTFFGEFTVVSPVVKERINPSSLFRSISPVGLLKYGLTPASLTRESPELRTRKEGDGGDRRAPWRGILHGRR